MHRTKQNYSVATRMLTVDRDEIEVISLKCNYTILVYYLQVNMQLFDL